MSRPEVLQSDSSKWQVAPRNHAVLNPALPKALGVVANKDRTEELVDVVLAIIFEKIPGPVSTITREDLVKRSIRVESGEWNSIKRDKLRNWKADPERESPNVGNGILKKLDYVDLRELKPGTIICWQGARPSTNYLVKKINDEFVKVWRAGIPSGFVGRLEDISVWGHTLGNNGSRQLEVYSGMVIEKGFLGTDTAISMPYFLKTEGGGVLPPNDYWVDIVKNLRIKEPG